MERPERLPGDGGGGGGESKPISLFATATVSRAAAAGRRRKSSHVKRARRRSLLLPAGDLSDLTSFPEDAIAKFNAHNADTSEAEQDFRSTLLQIEFDACKKQFRELLDRGATRDAYRGARRARARRA